MLISVNFYYPLSFLSVCSYHFINIYWIKTEKVVIAIANLNTYLKWAKLCVNANKKKKIWFDFYQGLLLELFK